MKVLSKWLNRHTKEVSWNENTYEPTKPRIQSTVDEGKGLSFNDKANHIFTEIKKMKQ